jgi:hypothetical protein
MSFVRSNHVRPNEARRIRRANWTYALSSAVSSLLSAVPSLPTSPRLDIQADGIN